jgi:hypothetical protein
MNSTTIQSFFIFAAAFLILLPKAFFSADTSDSAWHLYHQLLANEQGFAYFYTLNDIWLTNLIVGKIIGFFTVWFEGYEMLINRILACVIHATCSTIIFAISKPYFKNNFFLLFVLIITVNTLSAFYGGYVLIIADYITIPLFFTTVISAINYYIISNKYKFSNKTYYILGIVSGLLFSILIQTRMPAALLIVQYLLLLFTIWRQKDDEVKIRALLIAIATCILVTILIYISIKLFYISPSKDVETWHGGAYIINIMLNHLRKIILYTPILVLVFFVSYKSMVKPAIFKYQKYVPVILYILLCIFFMMMHGGSKHVLSGNFVNILVLSLFIYFAIIDWKKFKTTIPLFIILTTGMISVSIGSDQGFLKSTATIYFLIPIIGIFIYENKIIAKQMLYFFITVFCICSIFLYNINYNESNVFSDTGHFNLTEKMTVKPFKGIYTSKEKKDDYEKLVSVISPYIINNNVITSTNVNGMFLLFSLYTTLNLMPVTQNRFFKQFTLTKEICDKSSIVMLYKRGDYLGKEGKFIENECKLKKVIETQSFQIFGNINS